MFTGTMTVDTSGEWLVARSVSNHIHIAEDDQRGTADWTMQAPDASSPVVTVPAGQARDIFTAGRFLPGEKVALLAAATGSMTFTWMEML
ncbi:MAG: hypothetical protein ACRD2E_11555 [Terriglobales bacterium]